MIKPKRLEKGSTIAVISPSWGGPNVFPHTYEQGIRRLKEFGFKIKEYPTTRMDNEILYNNPQIRAKDINDAFADTQVDGIICTIGGEDSVRILKYLDTQIIKNNPKFIMGYSDNTTFLAYFNMLGLVTFNGPIVMAGFAESLKLEDDFIKHINSFLFEKWETYEYKKFSRYTHSYLDWRDSKNLLKENTNYVKNIDDWNFIQGQKNTQGELFGGCIDVLEMLKGTKFWPNDDFWKGKILFLETSEDKPGPVLMRYILRNYGMLGILNKINGIIWGRSRDYTKEEEKELEEGILQVLKEFNREDMPVVTNVDFGHTDPQLIIPLGCKLKIDIEEKKLILMENPFN